MSTTVAIAGYTGLLGKPTLDALVSTKLYKLPIHVITRDASKHQDTAEAKYFTADFDKLDTLEAPLKGVEVLIDLTSAKFSRNLLVDAAAKQGVKVFFPSEYGLDHYNTTNGPVVVKGKQDLAAYARSKGLKTVQLYTGSFPDFWNVILGILGIDRQNKTGWVVEEGNSTGSVTTLQSIANSLAALAHRPAAELKDEVRIQDTQVSGPELIEAYERKHAVKLAVSKVPAKKLIADVEQAIKENSPTLFLTFLTAAFNVDGFSNSDFSSNNDNDYVSQGTFEWVSKDKIFADFL